MDFGGYLSLGMKRMEGGNWTSGHRAEKIQEMLSRAIRDQEDLWKILISSAPSCELGESAAAHGEGQLEAAEFTRLVSPRPLSHQRVHSPRDPSVFEVTYMDIHTCSSSNYRHKKQHRVAADHVPAAAADAAPTQESRKLLGRHQSPKRIRNAQRDQAASVVRQQKEKDNSLAGAAATSVKGEEKSQARILQPDHQKNNVVSTLDLPAAAGSTDQDGEEKVLDLHLQAADFSIWSTELGAAAHATADQLTTSSDLDSFAEEAPSSNNYSRSDQAVAATHDDHQQQDSKTFALDHQHEEPKLQGDRSHQTAVAAIYEADLHMQETMNAAGYLASGLEGIDIHQLQLQLHHLHHHGHIHGQLPNAQALPSFHESTIFDSWADLCMDMHHLG
ncbi:unnamed protein product [Sphagnum troendelagicum]|uniref:Uncharacterized protein n=1 Tax=Sphagnum troendelagicum TaxID=128251 RepID=A0ABP0U4W6_9BRYO